MTKPTRLFLIASMLFFAFGAGMIFQAHTEQRVLYSAPLTGANPATADQDMDGFDISDVTSNNDSWTAPGFNLTKGLQVTRDTNFTTGADDVLQLTRKSSGDMQDGFGSLFRFIIEDDTSGPQLAGHIGAIRDGADNKGALLFQAGVDGTETLMTLSDTGFNMNKGLRVTRDTDFTTGADDVLQLTRKSSGAMQDGFGSLFRFIIADDTSGSQLAGHIGAVRDGADDEGALIFQAGTDGSEEFMRIDNNGNIILGAANPSITSSGEICIGNCP